MTTAVSSAPSSPGWLRRALFPLGMLAGLAGVAWMMFGHSLMHGHVEQLPPEPPRGSTNPRAIAVTVTPVRLQTVERTVEAVGTLYGYEEVVLRAKVEGRVKRIHHDVSDRVTPGSPILEVDPLDAELAVRQAEKSLLAELARLGLTEPPDRAFNVRDVPLVAQAQIRLDNIRSRVERVEQLAKRTVITGEELAERKSELRAAEAEVAHQILVANAGLATIQMRQEALAIAQKQLADTVIRVPTLSAPVPGLPQVRYAVTRRSVSEGTFVRVGDEVCKLTIDETLKLRVAVPERYAADVQTEQSVKVTTAASTTPFPGTVLRINPAVDPATRTFEVEILCPNPEGRMKPGGFAKAAIITKQQDQAVTVPLEALVTFAGISKVFTADGDHCREVRVTLGIQTTDWVEIASPVLPVGTRVVTSGQTALADESPLFIRAPADEAASEAGQPPVLEPHASAGSAP